MVTMTVVNVFCQYGDQTLIQDWVCHEFEMFLAMSGIAHCVTLLKHLFWTQNLCICTSNVMSSRQAMPRSAAKNTLAQILDYWMLWVQVFLL